MPGILQPSRMARNLLNLKSVAKGYGARSVLTDVTLGVAEGERIGIVGRNGDGKSTLLALMAGTEQPDAGQVTRANDLTLAAVAQRDELDGSLTVGEALVAGHERAAETREVVAGLLHGLDLAAPIAPLSGGERRRIALAQALLDRSELLLLDEPTNHLDVEGVAWLAAFLRRRRGTLVVITHDRWFLDEVVDQTWEVGDGVVRQFEGGYAAYVLARAERERQAAVVEERRQMLVRKELAWLRRGPPARTSKPKFRIEAANALIEDVPQPRDRAELLRFATGRLGKKVVDVEDASVAFGSRTILDGVTWRLGPGDRVALVGVNGAGKSTLLSLVAGTREPDTGRVDRGATVKVAELSQQTAEVPGHLRVLEALHEVRGRTRTAGGEELTAGQLAERFGFRGERQRTQVQDLSGGERRRLQLMRILLDEPNVLLLDEPTNDLDTDTLTALEDLLDGWPGTLVVVSHDRYFVERVTDDVFALLGDGDLRHLPGGIEQYLELRRAAQAAGEATPTSATPTRRPGGGGAARAARKEAARLERAIERLDERDAALQARMAEQATDFAALRGLQGELAALRDEREALETAWLEASEAAEA
jgi:ATP-binding cassette subfamily F protein uup